MVDYSISSFKAVLYLPRRRFVTIPANIYIKKVLKQTVISRLMSILIKKFHKA